MGNKVTFYPNNCFVSSLDKDKVIFSGERVENIYAIDLNKIDNKDVKCLMTVVTYLHIYFIVIIA